MRAPLKSVLAVGVAFAAGVAATAAIVGSRPETAAVRQGMMRAGPQTAGTGAPTAVAALSPAPEAPSSGVAPSASNAWTDPVRQRAGAPAARPPLPPLVFHVDRAQERAQDNAARVSAPPDDDAANHGATARVPPRRPKPSDLLAKLEDRRDPAPAPDVADRPSPARPSALAPAPRQQAPRQAAGPQRKPGGVRTASTDVDQDEARFAPERPARRLVRARRDEVLMASGPYPLRHVEFLDRYERDAPDWPQDRAPVYRRRVTAAETGGVMRWLGVP
ncbi:hypothetical protein [Methylobacterium sp. J-070]|uniref:hypothetical protein n=1 Tax=Methylobacterium sp. J-070 TaxID=2836650 RepID=UPI001FBBB40D|nr:hypothetical protein [Methylobacterium sp. J-070]MCJ2050748.1 hypothetical protein [Methylobacterium sp. J-070]